MKEFTYEQIRTKALKQGVKDNKVHIGLWATIYCQQILLGMLTIFGPIQWAFSLLPKWEGAWAKWLIRYLTVHFYGAMLYFVGLFRCVTH